jgi:hypothetical protein
LPAILPFSLSEPAPAFADCFALPTGLNFFFTRRSIFTVTLPAFDSRHLKVIVLPARGFFGETAKPETVGAVITTGGSGPGPGPGPGAGTFTVHVRVAGLGSLSLASAATWNVCWPFGSAVKLRPPGHDVNAPPSSEQLNPVATPAGEALYVKFASADATVEPSAGPESIAVSGGLHCAGVSSRVQLFRVPPSPVNWSATVSFQLPFAFSPRNAANASLGASGDASVKFANG